VKPHPAKSIVLGSALLLLATLCPARGYGQEPPKQFILNGRCVSPDGMGISNAQARAEQSTVGTDEDGRFRLALQPGDHRFEITAPGFTPLHVTVSVMADSEFSFELQPSTQVTVHAGAETLSPDPSARSISREDAVAANPGWSGVPVSIPGYPAETASGGIKAPQYFAPGVASDHGVLIGNCYADPNILISPDTIGGVESDAAAFDVRYGDHALNLSTTYGLRSQLGPLSKRSRAGHDLRASYGGARPNAPLQSQRRGAGMPLWSKFSGFRHPDQAQQRNTYLRFVLSTW